MNRFVLPVANLPTSFYDFASDVESAIDHIFNGKTSNQNQSTARYSPRLSIYECDDSFVVAVDLPGMKPQDVQIEVKENQLSIAGERTSEFVRDGVKAWKDERFSGAFRRVLQLPENIDGDRVDAVYDAGVLTVTVPKAVKPTARQITIRSTSQNAGVDSQQALSVNAAEPSSPSMN